MYGNLFKIVLYTAKFKIHSGSQEMNKYWDHSKILYPANILMKLFSEKSVLNILNNVHFILSCNFIGQIFHFHLNIHREKVELNFKD